MQQPLCHLYFMTLLEHLTSEPRDINTLVRVAETISQVREDNGEGGRGEGHLLISLSYLFSAMCWVVHPCQREDDLADREASSDPKCVEGSSTPVYTKQSGTIH